LAIDHYSFWICPSQVISHASFIFRTGDLLYINLYSPTSGSKEKKTYIHINTVKKTTKTKKNREQVYMPLCCYMR